MRNPGQSALSPNARFRAGRVHLGDFVDTACLLSVVQSCRFQKRSVIDFFADALRTSIGHQTTNLSLIPIF